MCSLAFFTRTHIHDSTVPSWADSDDAIAFVSEVLKLEPMEFLARFEQWACARTKGMYCLSDVIGREANKAVSWWPSGESADFAG
jgi:hypothetical protein